MAEVRTLVGKTCWKNSKTHDAGAEIIFFAKTPCILLKNLVKLGSLLEFLFYVIVKQDVSETTQKFQSICDYRGRSEELHSGGVPISSAQAQGEKDRLFLSTTACLSTRREVVDFGSLQGRGADHPLYAHCTLS
jgi:hypothetical protein